MKASKNSAGESLDLLLDTICNTFGAIILIAILVAIITQNTPSPNDVLESTSAELLDRQIATSQREIEELREVVNSASSISSEVETLRSERSRLRTEIQVLLGTDAHDNSEANTSIEGVAQEINDSSSAIAEAKQNAAQMENALSTARENSERLAKRLLNLQKSLGEVRVAQQRELRFPKERSSDLSPIWIMFRGDRIIPLVTPSLDPNWRDFDLKEGESGVRYTAKSGAGFASSEATRIATDFSSAVGSKESWFFACLVSPDSVDAFAAFREASAKAGLNYGWEPHDQPSVTLTDKGGTKPNPL
jgi:FtsZ-binding cell division protein ZapB